jgi:hypothetical protein
MYTTRERAMDPTYRYKPDLVLILALVSGLVYTGIFVWMEAYEVLQ